MPRVAVIVGSLRKNAYSRLVSRVLIASAPDHINMKLVEIGQLPFYNQDLEEAQPPEPWLAFRHTIKAVDAVLFVTPEYNRSMPAALKNAIDVGSRPRGQNIWSEKAAGVVSVSPGAIGGFGANNHLRQSLMAVNMPTLQHPEAYIGGVAPFFDSNGELINDDTRAFLKLFMDTFATWIDTVRKK